MAKAKIIRRKRRLRIEGLATLVLSMSVLLFFGSRYALKSYNYTLTYKQSAINDKANQLKEEVANLESEINALKNRDRVLSVAGKDNIKTNQDNVTVVGKDEE